MKVVPQDTYTKEYYEHDCGGHEDWNATKGKVLPPRLEAAFKIAKLKRGMKVLDWGCGRGEISYQAAKKGARVLGLDYAKAAIDLTKSLPKVKTGKMEFRLITDLKIPAKDNTFDRIFFIDVIEHLYPMQVDEVMSEFERVLKPGGYLIVHTAPNRDYYDVGYKVWTRWWHMLVNPAWYVIFRETLRDDVSPRFGYDAKVHVNECTKDDVQMFIERAGLSPDVWYDSAFRNQRKRDKIRYAIFQPQLGPFKKWFSEDIWATGTKKSA